MEVEMKPSLYLGIDVSKGYADFIMLNADRKEIDDPFQLFDVVEGYDYLASYIRRVVEEYHPEQIYAAVESTGGLENHWIRVIYELGAMYPIKIARLNPFGVSKHRQADMKVQITDRSSCIAIARYLINHADRIRYYQPDEYAKLRLYLSQIELLVKHKVQLINKLRQHLYLYFPEISSYCRSKMTESILHLLEKYPTAQAMSRARLSKNCSVSYTTQSDFLAIRNRCKCRQHEDSDPIAEFIIRDAARQILGYDQKINQIYDMVYSELPQDKLKIIESMPGVGKKTAVVLLCVIGDVRRFESAHQMVGFFGLYPVIKESGDGKKKPHLSKKGNVLLRKRLYLSAMVACTHDPYLRTKYLALVDKGVAKKSAICIVMHKMLRMIYGMLGKNQGYDHHVDQMNREMYQTKAIRVPLVAQNTSLTEEINMICIAPISKKNAHHRKEQTRALLQTQGLKLPAAPSNFLPNQGS